MKSKQILRFYFTADSLNRALDNLILKKAVCLDDYGRGGENCAREVCELVEKKCELQRLWGYLHSVIQTFSAKERAVLEYYGRLRTGLSKLSCGRVREVKRVTVKFSRRARQIERYAEGLRLIKEYYCLLKA